jgi:hypothetical protein
MKLQTQTRVHYYIFFITMQVLFFYFFIWISSTQDCPQLQLTWLCSEWLWEIEIPVQAVRDSQREPQQTFKLYILTENQEFRKLPADASMLQYCYQLVMLTELALIIMTTLLPQQSQLPHSSQAISKFLQLTYCLTNGTVLDFHRACTDNLMSN